MHTRCPKFRRNQKKKREKYTWTHTSIYIDILNESRYRFQFYHFIHSAARQWNSRLWLWYKYGSTSKVVYVSNRIAIYCSSSFLDKPLQYQPHWYWNELVVLFVYVSVCVCVCFCLQQSSTSLLFFFIFIFSFDTAVYSFILLSHSLSFALFVLFGCFIFIIIIVFNWSIFTRFNSEMILLRCAYFIATKGKTAATTTAPAHACIYIYLIFICVVWMAYMAYFFPLCICVIPI